MTLLLGACASEPFVYEVRVDRAGTEVTIDGTVGTAVASSEADSYEEARTSLVATIEIRGVQGTRTVELRPGTCDDDLDRLGTVHHELRAFRVIDGTTPFLDSTRSECHGDRTSVLIIDG